MNNPKVRSLYQSFKQRFEHFSRSAPADIFRRSKIGLEKESLRVASTGGIAQTTHPRAFGSALTHPYITTDYSEALLEFVTAPYSNKSEMLRFLADVQTFVYSKLEDEILWATSMPCVLAGEPSIQIAKYGDSNLGQMKTIYRRGLGHRYGRVMQVIAGVHFNYSFADDFWKFYQTIEQNNVDQKTFVATSYFQLIRNFQRNGWLIPYLFGSSPAVCKSFLGGGATDMELFDKSTYYYPYATSLRTGDIGYQNSKEKELGIRILYDSLHTYVASLSHAINTPNAAYAQLGVKVNGQYEQLNGNLLQIENEYYSSVRPKQIADSFEMPVNALRDRGVAYVELRSMDINPYEALGVSEKSIYFLETFSLFCLLHDSPITSEQEYLQNSRNLLNVAHNGRKPGLSLLRGDQNIALKTWAFELFELMDGIAELLDQKHKTKKYTTAVSHYRKNIEDPDSTISAQMINEMRENKESFFHFSLRKSQQHSEYFKKQKLSAEQEKMFSQLSENSIKKQIEIEQSDTISLDEFLAAYFLQSKV